MAPRNLRYEQGFVAEESYLEGALEGWSLLRLRDAEGRLASLELIEGGQTRYAADYRYRDGRLWQVDDRSGNLYEYGYLPGSGEVASLARYRDGELRLRSEYAYDGAGRQRLIVHYAGDGSVIESFLYAYDALGSRERVELSAGQHWLYGYDRRGQVASASLNTSDGQALPGHGRSYRYDDIGNRVEYASEGPGAVWSERWQHSLANELTEKESARWIDVLGISLTGAGMTVNGEASDSIMAYQAREGFDLYYGAVNAGKDRLPESPAWQRLEVEATLEDPDDLGSTLSSRLTRHQYAPPTPEVRAYDADGNLLRDSRWDYTWDARNRLVAMETRPAAFGAGVPRQRVEFEYDAEGRRHAKKVFQWDTESGIFHLQSSSAYLYDGWNLIAELRQDLHASPFALHSSFVHGLDIAGSLGQAAGGVGALLGISWSGSADETAYPFYDGNGNIMGLVDRDGVSAARYTYDAFGNTILREGRLAEANSFRFSTKYFDDVTELYYYGYRYYDAGLGRWLNRDPIEEQGGLNLYGFVGNDGVNDFDRFGLTGRRHIRSGRLFYTYHFGWIDAGHASKNYSLDRAWRAIRSAKSGEEIKITLSLSKPGVVGKTHVKTDWTIVVKSGEEERKMQLLCAFQGASEVHEGSQYDGSGSWWRDPVYALFNEVPSGFSLEDLVSNTVGFYMTVDGLSLNDILSESVAGRIPQYEKDFSRAIWDLGHPLVPAAAEWTPGFADLDSLLGKAENRYQSAKESLTGIWPTIGYGAASELYNMGRNIEAIEAYRSRFGGRLPSYPWKGRLADCSCVTRLRAYEE